MVNGTVFQAPNGGLCSAAQAAENASVVFAWIEWPTKLAVM